MVLQKQHFLRLAGWLSAALLALVMALPGSAAAGAFNNGGNLANGGTTYTAQGCGDCHGNPPDGSNDNYPGANQVSVLNYAITNNLGGAMGAFSGLSAQQRLDLTRYIGNYVPGNVNNTGTYTVTFNSTGQNLDVSAYVNTCTDYNSCNATGTSPDGTITSLAVTANPGHGTITAISGSVFTYKPVANYYGSDSFTYHAVGPDGNSTSATVFISVPAPAPTLGAVPTQVVNYANPATVLNINLAGYITNPYTSVTVTSAPAKGTIGTISGATIPYTPTVGDFGSDSFNVLVTGPGGTATGTINVSINTPTPGDVASGTTTAYNTSKTVDLSTLITNYVPGATTFTIDQQPADATMVLVVSGNSVTYTPSASFYGGMDFFKYHATNPGNPAGASVAFTFTVGQPPLPVPNNTTTSVSFDSSSNPLTLNVTNPYNLVSVTTPAMHGTATASGTTIVYTPTPGYTGPDSVGYSATSPDGMVSATSATVAITVQASATPVAGSATLAATYNVPLHIDMSTVITNPAQGITIGTAPTHGTLSIAGLAVTYTQTANYVGTDFFTYTAVGYPSTNTSTTPGTITINTAAPNAPVATGFGPVLIGYNAAATPIDLSGAITGAAPLSALVGTAMHGTVTVSGETASYKPNTNYYGADSFTFQGTNSGGPGNTATVTLTVHTPPAPVAAAASLTVPYNGSNTLDLTGSVSGVDTPPLQVGTAPAHGTVVFNGSIATYTSALNFFGSDSFTYIAPGPGGNSNAATVTVTVVTPNAPVAGANTLAVAYGTSGSVDLTTKATGVYNSEAIATQPAHGTVSLAGSVATYTPANLYYGSDSFTYTVTGPGGTSAPGTISVTVGLPAAPTTQSSSLNVIYNTAQSVNLAAYLAGVYSSAAIASQPAHGTATLNGTTLLYTPTNGYYGPDSLTFTATGPGGTSGPGP